MKKIIVLAVCISLFVFTPGFAAGPVTLEDFQKQRDDLIRLSQDNAGQIKAYNSIIDIATRAKIAAVDLQSKIKIEYDKVDESIKKLLAVPKIPPVPDQEKPE